MQEGGTDAANITPGGPGYVALYGGIAEGCLGHAKDAQSLLAEALQLRVGLFEDSSVDMTCNAQLLLAFGFGTYLNQAIAPVCPTTTSTTQDSTPTAG